MKIYTIHEAGLTHLDIKPENILLVKDSTDTKKLQAKVSDFGLARGVGMEGLAVLEDGIGTPAYMAPEQIKAARWQDVGPEADIYALGMILYEMIDGDLPYSGTAKQIKEKKLDGSVKIKKLSKDFANSELVNKCLKRKPGKRIQSINQLISFMEVGVDDIDEDKMYNGFTETVNDLNLEMVFVKGGTLRIGSDTEYSLSSTFKSQDVSFGDFFICKYPVTQKQWLQIMPSNRSAFVGGNNPVERVSWQDAQIFIERLNKLTSKKYRLPTDAEWEYAARGGQESNFFIYSGSDNLNDVGWFQDNSNIVTHPVGEKNANELGLFDMSGNVWEWCADYFESNVFLSSQNPQGPSFGTDRVIRGGSHFHLSECCRVNYRSCAPPDYRESDPPIRTDYSIGFRLVLTR